MTRKKKNPGPSEKKTPSISSIPSKWILIVHTGTRRGEIGPTGDLAKKQSLTASRRPKTTIEVATPNRKVLPGCKSSEVFAKRDLEVLYGVCTHQQPTSYLLAACELSAQRQRAACSIAQELLVSCLLNSSRSYSTAQELLKSCRLQHKSCLLNSTRAAY